MFRFLFTTILVRFAEAILYEVHGDGTVEFFEDTDNASDKTYMQAKRRRHGGPSFDDVDGDSGSFSSSKDSDESQKEVEVEQKTYSPTQFLLYPRSQPQRLSQRYPDNKQVYANSGIEEVGRMEDVHTGERIFPVVYADGLA